MKDDSLIEVGDEQFRSRYIKPSPFGLCMEKFSRYRTLFTDLKRSRIKTQTSKSLFSEISADDLGGKF